MSYANIHMIDSSTITLQCTNHSVHITLTQSQINKREDNTAYRMQLKIDSYNILHVSLK